MIFSSRYKHETLPSDLKTIHSQEISKCGDSSEISTWEGRRKWKFLKGGERFNTTQGESLFSFSEIRYNYRRVFSRA